MGGYTRAIPYFEQALSVAPQQYAAAHYNLGEVYRAKGKCPQALMHYALYQRSEAPQPQTLKLTESAIAQCNTPSSRLAHLSLEATQNAYVSWGPWQVPASWLKDPLPLPPGNYDLVVTAPDYIPQSRSVSLRGRRPADPTL